MSGPRFIAGTCNACGESAWSDRDHHCEVATLRARLDAYKGHAPEAIERRFAEYESAVAALRERAEAAEREAARERVARDEAEQERDEAHRCNQVACLAEDHATARADAAEARASLLERALRDLCVTAERIAFTHRYTDEARSWGKLPPEAVTFVRALEAASAALEKVGEGPPPTRGEGR
jgi:chromosome segregation ATPase